MQEQSRVGDGPEDQGEMFPWITILPLCFPYLKFSKT